MINKIGQTPLYCAARQGFVPIVAELISCPSLDLDVQMTAHGGTALHGIILLYVYLNLP